MYLRTNKWLQNVVFISCNYNIVHVNKFKKIINTVLGVSKSEFTGFKWLIITSIICVLGVYLVNKYTQHPYNNYDKDVKKLDSLIALMENSSPTQNTKSLSTNLSYFDPNSATKEQLLQNAFPEWLANRLINFRAKGGVFNKPKDLLNIYNFPDSLYIKVEPYVLLNKSKKTNPPIVYQEYNSKKMIPKKVDKPIPLFDINKADTSILQTVKGIGSVLSNRIISYRAGLGGFVSTNQLHEIYNLDSTTINNLLNISFISKEFKPTSIFINTMDEKQLASHPYITWKQAKLLIAYRNQHGNYNSKEDLLKVYLLNEEWYKKIAPYLAF